MSIVCSLALSFDSRQKRKRRVSLSLSHTHFLQKLREGYMI
ncbi:unnamed protein product [Brassica oleracea]